MFDGLRVRLVGNQQDIVCRDHPEAPLEKGSTDGYPVFWKCSRCHNSAQWTSEADREAEVQQLVAKSSTWK